MIYLQPAELKGDGSIINRGLCGCVTYSSVRKPKVRKICMKNQMKKLIGGINNEYAYANG